MKFMKLGTMPDTFQTAEATRIVIADVPSDIVIRINNVNYLLHKLQHALLPKSGLLQQLLSKYDDSKNVRIELHDIPGGEEAFELCAKFCYGITINLSAQNFVSCYCAASFLKMTETAENGNLVAKLDSFFSSCILQGWKDTILALQMTHRLAEWSENLGIVRRCKESVADKILTPTNKVTWSFTYTRSGYEKKLQRSVPKDWWTEDLSFLDLEIFRWIISAVESRKELQPQLIGEALHVYATRRLFIKESAPAESSSTFSEEQNKKRILETIVSLIPADKGSVSVRFLLRLLWIANMLVVSPKTKAELLRLTGLKLDETTLEDLMLVHESGKGIELIQEVLESYLSLWNRGNMGDEDESMDSLINIGKLIDLYLQVAAKEDHLQVQKMVSLAQTLPETARPQHNDLYKAINIYLKEHPDLSKADKKKLCGMLDSQKLSEEVRADAARNELLPLRTVIRILFFEQEKSGELSLKVRSSRSKSGNSEPGTSRGHEDKRQIREELSFKVRDSMESEIESGKKT